MAHPDFVKSVEKQNLTKDGNMRLWIIIALAVFWLAMAYLQFYRRHIILGILFLIVGVALTIYRLRKRRI